MKLFRTAFSAAILTGGLAIAAPAAADDLDTFSIDVVLADLITDDGADEFETRLQRAARSYCEESYMGSDRRALRDCEEAVVAAVYDALEDESVPMMMASSESR